MRKDNLNSEKEKRTINIEKMIRDIEQHFGNGFRPYVLRDLKRFQIRKIKNQLEKNEEYKIKEYRDELTSVVKIFPVGKLRRLAEQKAQEVIMKGTSEALPPMGAFERFIIHDYLKDREGIKTESFGIQGKDRHVEIQPVFGRTLKKSRRRLIK